MNNDTIVIKTYKINNKEYVVINELDYKNVHYLFLSNEENAEDMMIRKVVDGYLESLDDENEISEVLKQIAK